MKRFIVSSILVLIGIIGPFSSEAQTLRRGDTILKDSIHVIPSEGGLLIGFVDERIDKIGFLLNRSDYIILIEPIYDDVYNENFWRSKRIIVKKDGKWGALGATLEQENFGKVCVPFIYDKMTPFKDGKSLVTLNGESFYIDEFGKRL